MDDMLTDNTPVPQALSIYDTAIALGKLLQDYRGRDVLAMDLRGLNTWTDFFVIATVTSSTHLLGLERHIREFSQEKNIDILRLSPRPRGWKASAEDEWLLIDLGAIVIHLMTPKTRVFYELERLWSAAPIIFQENTRDAGT